MRIAIFYVELVCVIIFVLGLILVKDPDPGKVVLLFAAAYWFRETLESIALEMEDQESYGSLEGG
jgi:hypothetical protein